VRKCPTCKRPIPEPSDRAAQSKDAREQSAPPFPFCSQRCKLADLQGWLSGRYVVSDALPFGDGDALPAEDE
jgi:endogenous inhibitor of DNA gyrase (YacG/DUF329 family)